MLKQTDHEILIFEVNGFLLYIFIPQLLEYLEQICGYLAHKRRFAQYPVYHRLKINGMKIRVETTTRLRNVSYYLSQSSNHEQKSRFHKLTNLSTILYSFVHHAVNEVK